MQLDNIGWQRHNRLAYSSNLQVAWGWFATVLGLGALVACLVIVLYHAIPVIFQRGIGSTARHSLSMSLGYAGLCATGQVLFGLLLALCTHTLSGHFLRRLVTTLMITVYCLQPFVVEDIWSRILGLDTADFAILVAASIWQFAPFAMLFFQVKMDEVDREQPWLAALESPSAFHRWRQIHLVSIAKLAGVLLILRFLWMYTKFDLPLLFQSGGHSSQYLVAVRIGKIAEGFTDACLWGGYMLLPLSAFLLIGILLQRVLRRKHFFAIEKALGSSSISRFRLERERKEPPRLQRAAKGDLNARSLIALGILVLFLMPFFAACMRYVPKFRLGSLQVLGKALINTFVIGGLAALAASLLGAFLAYLSQRGHISLAKTWRHAPALTYAVPLVLLSVFIVRIAPFLETIVRTLSIVWYKPLQSVFNVSSGTLAGVNLYLANGAAAFIAFVIFSLPFTFLVLRGFCSNPPYLHREQLALVDGMKSGMRFHWRIVIPNLGAAVLYAFFLSFIINWQDNSVPLRLQNSGFQLFSFQWKKLSHSEVMGQTELVAIGLVFSLLLGMLFFFLYPRLEALVEGRA